MPLGWLRNGIGEPSAIPLWHPPRIYRGPLCHTIGGFNITKIKISRILFCYLFVFHYLCSVLIPKPCIIWDNNVSGGGNEHHGYINHSNGNFINNSEALVKTMIKAATSDDTCYTLESIYNKAPQ